MIIGVHPVAHGNYFIWNPKCEYFLPNLPTENKYGICIGPKKYKYYYTNREQVFFSKKMIIIDRNRLCQHIENLNSSEYYQLMESKRFVHIGGLFSDTNEVSNNNSKYQKYKTEFTQWCCAIYLFYFKNVGWYRLLHSLTVISFEIAGFILYKFRLPLEFFSFSKLKLWHLSQACWARAVLSAIFLLMASLLCFFSSLLCRKILYIWNQEHPNINLMWKSTILPHGSSFQLWWSLCKKDQRGHWGFKKYDRTVRYDW